MKFLTVNTAGTTTEIAYFDGEKAHFYKDADGKKASEVLLLEIDRLLNGTPISEVDVFACVTGPGSFTGIRIGVNTVKAFCYAQGTPAIGISYNRALSKAVKGKSFSVVTGWADNCYVAVYGEKGEEILPPTAMSVEQAVALRSSSYSDYPVVIDTANYQELCKLGAKVVTSPEYLYDATVSAIDGGEQTSGDLISPYYAMKSQAERDLEK